MIYLILYLLTDYVEFSLKVWSILIGDAGDKHLLDVWLTFKCHLTQACWICRHITKLHQSQTLRLNNINHYLKDLVLLCLVFWQEDKSCTILTLFWNWDTLQQNKLVWYLYHNAGTITTLSVCTFSTTMHHVLQDFKSGIHKFMTLVAMYVYHHTDTTSIMLIRWSVKSFSEIVLHNFVSFRRFISNYPSRQSHLDYRCKITHNENF